MHKIGCPNDSSQQKDPINPSYYKGDSVMIFIEQFELPLRLAVLLNT